MADQEFIAPPISGNIYRNIVEDLTAGWRPIETAPKNGTPVLLGWLSSRFVTSGLWVTRSDDDPRWLTVHGPYSGSAAPTHWMPLPEPPQ